MKQFKLEEQKAAKEMVLNHFKWQIFCLTTIDPHIVFTLGLCNVEGCGGVYISNIMNNMVILDRNWESHAGHTVKNFCSNFKVSQGFYRHSRWT